MNTRTGVVLLVASTGLALTMAYFARPGPRRLEPQDACEAAEAIEQMGLFWNTGSAAHPEPIPDCSNLTVSTEPITTEEAASLAVGQPRERWRGKARAFSGPVRFGDDDVRAVAWGNLTLIGDPGLIARITGGR